MKEALTQSGLIKNLHDKGYDDITARRIIDWRGSGLLPPFDLKGGGRGKSQGRRNSAWSEGQRVLNQAIWVYKLLPIYKHFDRLYIPLWILGYEIPLWRIRESLREPLQDIVDVLKEQISNSGELEDLIGDEVYTCIKRMSSNQSGLLQVPQDTLEAFLNIILNRGYELNDYPFEKGVEDFKEWQHRYHQKVIASQSDKVTNGEITENEGTYDLSTFLFFLKQYLSLHSLKAAVDACTVNDLLIVERDLKAVREICLSIHKMTNALMGDLLCEFEPMGEVFLPVVLEFGKLLILADLSLRHNGFAEILDGGIDRALNWLRKEISEPCELRLAENKQDFTALMQSYIDRMNEGVYLSISPAE